MANGEAASAAFEAVRSSSVRPQPPSKAAKRSSSPSPMPAYRTRPIAFACRVIRSETTQGSPAACASISVTGRPS